MGVLWRYRSGRVFTESVLEKLESRSLLSATFAGSSLSVGAGEPYAIKAADLNGDGKQDIVTANYNGTVTVLLGNGNSTFQPPIVISDALQNGPTSMAVADLNSDGLPDLVVASRNSYGLISVLINQGNGKFATPELLAVAGNQTDSVAVADINGDNIPDILAANGYGVLSVLLGKGNGKFRHYTKESLPNATGQNVLAVGDFNNDGKPDLADANGFGVVNILLNNGGGTFRLASSTGVGTDPVSIAVADLNKDGKLDIVTGDDIGNVVVVLGNGDGTMQNGQSYYVAQQVEAVATGDFNGDGAPDIVFTVHTYYNYGYVGMLINNGNGTFQMGSNYATPAKIPQGIATGDFSGDGVDGVAAADASYAQVDLLTNTTPVVPTITLSAGKLIVIGTQNADTVNASVSGGNITITADATTQSFAMASVQSIVFSMLSGNDSVSLGVGLPPSLVRGGGGADTIIAGDASADTFNGGNGNDSIQCGSGADSMLGGLGNDTILGGAGADTIEGDAGADSLVGGAGPSHIIGNGGNDTLIAGDPGTTLRGNAGADSLDGRAGGDFLAGGPGIDTLFGSANGAATDTLTGNGGADSILAASGDSLLASAGGDSIQRSS